ncbi:MAG: Zn-dependent exopeptidase M28 [Spirochaetaceae bacterium]|nr:Zn-dependent exopeptidase M28 [Spirochaetaceae bacterium]
MLEDDLFLKAPYNCFREFISPEADRFALLCSVLDQCSLPRQVLEIAGKLHIAAGPEKGFNACGLIFTAHYDRTSDSSGANDNGAAVFQLIETALRIYAPPQTMVMSPVAVQTTAPPRRPVLFIFTDGEELSKGESLRRQGAYSLGLHLKQNGMGNSRIFTFDACGAGDTLIISTAADQLLKNETGPGADAMRRKVQVLRQTALEAARKARLENVLLLPTPFSEDAGFLLAGMTAQTITVLPQNEAAVCSSLVRNGKAAALLSNAVNVDRRLIPETWKSLNGPGDSPLRLTPEHWKKVSAFANALAML